MKKLIHAYTENQYKDYPAFINISQEEGATNSDNWWQTSATVMVRSAENGGTKIAELNMTLEQLEELAEDIFAYVYQGEA